MLRPSPAGRALEAPAARGSRCERPGPASTGRPTWMHSAGCTARPRSTSSGKTQCPGVLGRVALWGRVIEHECGYRARFAYPQRIAADLPVLLLDGRAVRHGAPTRRLVREGQPHARSVTSTSRRRRGTAWRPDTYCRLRRSTNVCARSTPWTRSPSEDSGGVRPTAGLLARRRAGQPGPKVVRGGRSRLGRAGRVERRLGDLRAGPAGVHLLRQFLQTALGVERAALGDLDPVAQGFEFPSTRLGRLRPWPRRRPARARPRRRGRSQLGDLGLVLLGVFGRSRSGLNSRMQRWISRGRPGDGAVAGASRSRSPTRTRSSGHGRCRRK